MEHYLFEGVTVIIIDDHNVLCEIGSKYIDLNPYGAANEKERTWRARVL